MVARLVRQDAGPVPAVSTEAGTPTDFEFLEMLGMRAALGSRSHSNSAEALVDHLSADGGAIVEWRRREPPVILGHCGRLVHSLERMQLNEALRAAGGPHVPPGLYSAVTRQEPLLVCAVVTTTARSFGLFVWGPDTVKSRMSLIRTVAVMLASAHPTAEPWEPPGPFPRDDEFPQDLHLGSAASVLRVYEDIRVFAAGDFPLLVLGETGTGKEHVSRLLHSWSPRRHGPFVAINCAAIPSDLLEAEMFGVARGAATGVSAREGKFVAAENGTLLLDEIGDMPAPLQGKILRAIQEREIDPLGGRPLRISARIVAATNQDLRQRIREGRFRADLYYRLAGAVLTVPPLRDRREDVPGLVRHFVDVYGRAARKVVDGVTWDAMEALANRPWPGNIRELENEMRRAVFRCRSGHPIGLETLTEPRSASEGEDESSEPTSLSQRMGELERVLIDDALTRTAGNRSEAARLLGISRNGLGLKLKRRR